MASLKIVEVTTPEQQEAFLQLPWRLYRDDPNWTPPLQDSQRGLVGFRPHPFYERNESAAFLALEDDEPCGRILAIWNKGYIEEHQEPLGFFGFFECINDRKAASGLFDAVRKWFAARDIHHLRGPTNPSVNHEIGLLVDGFDSPPTFLMTYNAPYYEQLITACGYEKSQDLYAYYGYVDMLEGFTMMKKFEFVVEQCIERLNLTLRPMDSSRFDEDVRMFLEIYNKAQSGNWGYVPMSEAEIDRAASELKHLIVPEMTSVAEIDGKPIGAVFGILDYNPRIKMIDGDLWPFGFLWLMTNRRALKRVRLVASNVLPEYQLWGVGLVLMARIFPDGMAFGIEEAEFSWVLESNHYSRKSLERGGARLEKTFRLYDWSKG